jgi:spore germination protein GerM
MSTESLKKQRFTETKNFLLFQSKVLKSQKTRVVLEDEEHPQYKVSKSLIYELQKLIDFLNMNELVKECFLTQIDQYTELLALVSIEENRKSLEISQEIFSKIEEIREEIKQIVLES